MVKSNKILVVVILMLLAVFAVIQHFIDINYGSLTIVLVGLAMLLLYKTKKKSWSLFCGSYLLFFGIIGFLIGFDVFSEKIAYALASMFFIIPGTVFLILYFQQNKKGLLIPASFFIWFGIYIFVFNILGFNQMFLSIFFIFAGLASGTTFLISDGSKRKFALYFAFAFITLGIVGMLGLFEFLNGILL